MPRCRAPNPCLPQQQDTIPHVVKKTQSCAPEDGQKFARDMSSWSLEINKTVIVASRWFLYYLTYIDDARSNTNQIYNDLYNRTFFHSFLQSGTLILLSEYRRGQGTAGHPP